MAHFKIQKFQNSSNHNHKKHDSLARYQHLTNVVQQHKLHTKAMITLQKWFELEVVVLKKFYFLHVSKRKFQLDISFSYINFFGV